MTVDPIDSAEYTLNNYNQQRQIAINRLYTTRPDGTKAQNYEDAAHSAKVENINAETDQVLANLEAHVSGLEAAAKASVYWAENVDPTTFLTPEQLAKVNGAKWIVEEDVAKLPASKLVARAKQAIASDPAMAYLYWRYWPAARLGDDSASRELLATKALLDQAIVPQEVRRAAELDKPRILAAEKLRVKIKQQRHKISGKPAGQFNPWE